MERPASSGDIIMNINWEATPGSLSSSSTSDECNGNGTGVSRECSGNDNRSDPPPKTKTFSDQRTISNHVNDQLKQASSITAATLIDSGEEFQVFLSFHGTDTRKGFTGHLFYNLDQRGISVFIDSENLEKGMRIDELFNKIERSQIFLPVFSKRYAESKWCLKEISKAVECDKKIVPVFFDVEPSDVRHQIGCFKPAFEQHENDEKSAKAVEKWRLALNKAGSISGYHLQNDTDGHEAKLIQVIVKDVMSLVATNFMDVAEHPVGLQSRLDDIKGMLEIESSDVRMIGIQGMGGIGKTTLAKAVLNKISTHFDGCSFISNVREISKSSKGMESLQMQLLRDILRTNNVVVTDSSRGIQIIKERVSSKKVLIVLDDVDDTQQLKALAGSRNWFGKGSRIIITTRDKKVLTENQIEEEETYEIEGLSAEHSMELFCYHAFRMKNPPDEDYRELAKAVVRNLDGLPLALEVLGSEFFDMKTPQEWQALLKKLSEHQHGKVHEKLKISYEGLDYVEKQIFLDIACFFIGSDKEYPIYMWEACGFHPLLTLKVLTHRSLIKVVDFLGESRFEMHDQIRDMGRTIVLQEKFLNYLHPVRSRLWDMTAKELQAIEVPTSVQGIRYDPSFEKRAIGTPCFWGSQYHRLRYLYVDGVKFVGGFNQFPTTSLKWLSLIRCQIKHPPADIDFGDDIVVLELGDTNTLASAFVEQSFVRKGMALERLKILDLRGTTITTTPDFSHVSCPFLEQLRLSYCIVLTTVHESIGHLKRLLFLDLNQCYKLSSLPNTLGGLTSLQFLLLDRTGIQTLPDSIGRLTNLRELSLDCWYLDSLPNTLGGMASLERLRLRNTCVKTIPDSMGDLTNLLELSLEECRNLSTLPKTLGRMASLKKLVLTNTSIRTIPHSIGELQNLCHLSLESSCEEIKVHPHAMQKLCSLKNLNVFGTVLESLELPNGIGNLMDVEELHLSSPELLAALPGHFWHGRIRSLEFADPEMEVLPDSIRQMKSLVKLSLKCEKLGVLPDFIGHMENIAELFLKCKRLRILPDSIGQMRNLVALSLECQKLKTLPDSTGQMKKLVRLSLACKNIKVLPVSISDLHSLEELHLFHCYNLSSLPLFPSSLVTFSASDCVQLEMASIFSQSILFITKLYLRNTNSSARAFLEQLLVSKEVWKKLTVLHLCCTKIVSTPDFSDVLNPCLEQLVLSGCKELTMVHESIGDLKRLVLLDLSRCYKFSTLPNSLGHIASLEELSLNQTRIQTLPDSIGELINLHKLSLNGCRELSSLPNTLGGMTSLEELWLDESSIQTLPDSIGELKNLRQLSIKNCQHLKDLPHNSIRKLCSLRSLHIHCTRLKGLKDDHEIDDLMDATELYVSSCTLLCELPPHYRDEKVRYLHLTDQLVETLPECIGQMRNLLQLSLKCRKLRALPDYTGRLHYLVELDVIECYDLTYLSSLPPSLIWLNVIDCTNLEMMASVSHLTSLVALSLAGCWSLRDVLGLEDIITNLKRVTLPAAADQGSSWCGSFNDDFKNRVLQVAGFKRLVFLGIDRECQQHDGSDAGNHDYKLCFGLPRCLPVSVKHIGILLYGETRDLANEEFGAGGAWTMHTAVVGADGCEVICDTTETFYPDDDESVFQLNEHDGVIMCLNEGYRNLVITFHPPQGAALRRVQLVFYSYLSLARERHCKKFGLSRHIFVET